MKPFLFGGAVMLVASLAAAQGTQPLPGDANSLQEMHGDWRVACVQQDGKKVCALSQQQTDPGTHQLLLAIELNAPAIDRAEGTLILPFGLALDRPWLLAPSPRSVLALLGLSVFSTALAFVIYFRLIQTLGSVGATAQAYLRVPIGVAVGIIFLGEGLTPTAWIGLAGVIAGVAAMTIPARESADAR